MQRGSYFSKMAELYSHFLLVFQVKYLRSKRSKETVIKYRIRKYRPTTQNNFIVTPEFPFKSKYNSHFYVSQFFSFLIFPPVSMIFFSLCYLFSCSEIKKNPFSVESLYHKDSTMSRPPNKALFSGVSTWMGDQI